MAYKMKTPRAAQPVMKAYKGIENGVVGAYKGIENAVVGTYKKVEDKFVETFLEKTGPPQADDKPES